MLLLQLLVLFNNVYICTDVSKYTEKNRRKKNTTPQKMKRKNDTKQNQINSTKSKIKEKDKKNPGAPSEIILLTSKCFKILSMSSKSKKAVLIFL